MRAGIYALRPEINTSGRISANFGDLKLPITKKTQETSGNNLADNTLFPLHRDRKLMKLQEESIKKNLFALLTTAGFALNI
ncbi:hypothetical protein [Roseibium sp.]|uniref:hypothetical protein n=1 Tax=Roseibium sp. TaxID=1936156 RepID=UPI003265AECC